MKSDSQRILGHKSRKIWILLGLVSIVLVSAVGRGMGTQQPAGVGTVALTFLSQAPQSSPHLGS